MCDLCRNGTFSATGGAADQQNQRAVTPLVVDPDEIAYGRFFAELPLERFIGQGTNDTGVDLLLLYLEQLLIDRLGNECRPLRREATGSE